MSKRAFKHVPVDYQIGLYIRLVHWQPVNYSSFSDLTAPRGDSHHSDWTFQSDILTADTFIAWNKKNKIYNERKNLWREAL